MSVRKATAHTYLRHALIAQWRGVADGPVMDLPLKSVADLVPQIVAQCGINDRLKLEQVNAVWKEIVGEFIAQHSKPDSISRGVLMVRLLQPAVHHALMMEKGKILKRLVAKLGAKAVRDLRFKHG